MITRVQVKNFRNLADIDVHLGPLTVLVGRNGTGKSTFLDVLRFVRDALRLGLDTAISQRGGIGAIRCWPPSEGLNDIEISLELKQVHGTVRYSFVIGTSQQEEQRVKSERLEINRGFVSETNSFATENGQWVDAPTSYPLGFIPVSEPPIGNNSLTLPFLSFIFADLRAIRDQITNTDFYTIFPNTLRLPQRMVSEDTLSEDGNNLATTLRDIKKQGSFYSELVSALGKVPEGVHNVRITDAGGYLVTELGHEEQNGSTSWFPLAQEADGTLRVLAILAALYQNAPHSLIAIEEPELNIHPGALEMLGEVIEEAATRQQVIITTQSPDLISRFSVDQLRIVERIGTETYIGPIDEGQREVINRQLFSAGDLLRIEGLHVSSQEETMLSHA